MGHPAPDLVMVLALSGGHATGAGVTGGWAGAVVVGEAETPLEEDS